MMVLNGREFILSTHIQSWQGEGSEICEDQAETRNSSGVQNIKFGISLDIGEEKINAKSPGRLSSSRLGNKVDDETINCKGNKVKEDGFHFMEVG